MNNSATLNKAIYYWDFFLLNGQIDDLVAAHNFMKDYKQNGGEDYDLTWEAIQTTLQNKLK